MSLLEGKVAVITGAGGGLGRTYALLFAREGARVVVNDMGGARDGTGASDLAFANAVVAEIREAGGVAIADGSDISTADGAAALIKNAIGTFGYVDILVNNAGILRDKTFLKMEEAAWEAVLRVHASGTFFCSQAFAKAVMTQEGGGRIVNTTSVSGMLGNFGQSNYSAAKAAIYGLTRTMSIELQKHKITVNAIAPIAKTRLTEDLPMFQGVETLTAEHVAPAALFLASPLCGQRTGHVLAVAGARMYAFKVVESAGRFKDGDGGLWTAQEIADNWESIVRT